MTYVFNAADDIRLKHPGCGVEKLYYSINPDFIGRDKFIDIMMQNGYRLSKKINYKRTTYGSRVNFPNLIEGISLNGPSQVWQSDITYIDVNNKFYYAVFIIDVYTKKIVGYSLSDHMKASANVKALKMALSKHKTPIVHHSDRGSQYTSNEYLNLLRDNNIEISMGLMATDNAYAERLNRTIKEEYLEHWNIKTYEVLKSQMKKAVKNYNNERLHNSINRKTPSFFEKEVFSLPLEERPIMVIYDNNENKLKTVNHI